MNDHGDTEELLASLHRVTDTTLTRLDVDALLVELLDRVVESLDADTAAVLLIDPPSGDLVARAARGIEEEVRQGVRVPMGRGFAGSIAATLQPRRLERVDATTVANPILWEKGIRVMLGVPLVSAGELIGVLHVGRLDDRPFTDEDAYLLQVVGDRVATATQARQLAVEQAAATMLERSLIPAALPACPGISFAARYIPTERNTVGGDWYDVFTVPSGDLWVVVGDVAGHGLKAAVVMGRIRSALRAYALLGLPPDQVLELLDQLVEHFELGTMATVACGVLKPPFDRIAIALAGHPPPVIATPHGGAVLVDAPADPPLGVAARSPRRCTDFEVPEEAVVTLYTDGLFERRGEAIDEGLDALRGVVTCSEPEVVARAVMHRMVGTGLPEDDIALVVLQRTESR